MNERISITLEATQLRPPKPDAAGAVLRLVLYKGEVYRPPQTARSIQVLAGQAWLTTAGQDIFVTPREEIPLPTKGDTLISALGQLPLVLEVYRMR
jgi:hypothetical protein